MSKILEIKILKLLKENPCKNLEKSTLEELIDLFYIHKNHRMFNLLNKELEGYSNDKELPEYRKNIKVIANKEFVDGNKGYKSVNKEVEGHYIGTIIKTRHSEELWKQVFIFDEKSFGGLDYKNVYDQIYLKFNPILINEIEKIISNNFKI